MEPLKNFVSAAVVAPPSGCWRSVFSGGPAAVGSLVVEFLRQAEMLRNAINAKARYGRFCRFIIMLEPGISLRTLANPFLGSAGAPPVSSEGFDQVRVS